MRTFLIALLALAASAAGCGAPEPGSPAAPPAAPAAIATNQTTQAADSVGSIPGSPNALFVYRFKMTEPGGSSQFNYRDRDLSFYFRPSPNALYFQVENLQGRPVSIDWERSQFLDPNGDLGKVGHSSSNWKDRYNPQVLTQVSGQQRYSDYTFPLDNLLDPGTSDEQLRRPLLPEDASAPTYSGRTFGADLVFVVEGQPRTYSFRFQVASVIPR